MASKNVPWDYFSRVDASKIELSDDEDDAALEEAKRPSLLDKSMLEHERGERAIVPSTGYTPGTLTDPARQRILTEDEMMAGGGMGAIDLDDWKCTQMEGTHVGQTMDASGGKGLVMKTLVRAGTGTDNPTYPAQPELSFVGRVKEVGSCTGAEGGIFINVEAPTVYATRTRDDLAVPDDRFELLRPEGLKMGVISMREGETSTLTLKPEVGYGVDGDATLGVPPNATLEFEVTLHRIIDTQAFASGSVFKRRLVKGQLGQHGNRHLAPSPQPNAEVKLLWSGVLEEDGYEFRPPGVQEFWLGDPDVPPFWSLFLNSFRRGEVAEVTMDADTAFGDDGSIEYDVPPGCPVRLSVTLLDFYHIDDISSKHDRSALKRVIAAGLGVQTAGARFECTVDLEVKALQGSTLADMQHARAHPPSTVAADAADADADAADADADGTSPDVPVLYTGRDLIHTVGDPAPSYAAAAAAACGGAGVAAAVDLLLATCELDIACELAVSPLLVGGSHEHGLLLTLRLKSWVRNEPVDATDGAVWKRVGREGDVRATRPNHESTCGVRYSVRLAEGAEGAEGGAEGGGELVYDSGDAVVYFNQGTVEGGRSVLPAIDASVTAMRVGELATLECPPEYGYSAPLYTAPDGLDRYASRRLVVSLELVSCERAREGNALSLLDRMERQWRWKEEGNTLWAQRAIPEAVVKWEASIKVAPHRLDLLKGRPEREGGRPMIEREAEVEAMQAVLVATHLNLSLALLRLGRPDDALTHVEKALELRPTSVKATYRRAMCRLALRPVDVESVRADLAVASAAEPRNKEVHAALAQLRAVEAEHCAAEKRQYGGMFGEKGEGAREAPAASSMHEQD